MKNHTFDVGKRAGHIADREAMEYYHQTRGDFFKKWIEVYDQVLMELSGIYKGGLYDTRISGFNF